MNESFIASLFNQSGVPRPTYSPRPQNKSLLSPNIVSSYGLGLSCTEPALSESTALIDNSSEMVFAGSAPNCDESVYVGSSFSQGSEPVEYTVFAVSILTTRTRAPILYGRHYYVKRTGQIYTLAYFDTVTHSVYEISKKGNTATQTVSILAGSPYSGHYAQSVFSFRANGTATYLMIKLSVGLPSRVNCDVSAASFTNIYSLTIVDPSPVRHLDSSPILDTVVRIGAPRC